MMTLEHVTKKTSTALQNIKREKKQIHSLINMYIMM